MYYSHSSAKLSPGSRKKWRGRNAENYRAGGARGECAGGTSEEAEMTNGTSSSRFVTGAMAIAGDGVATTEPAVEHSGQRCDADGVTVSSQQ